MNAIVYKGIFVVMPLAASSMVYDMSDRNGQSVVTAAVSVAGKAYTAEELEYMAAVRAAARFHLPSVKLRALAARCRVPSERYDTEEEKPF